MKKIIIPIIIISMVLSFPVMTQAEDIVKGDKPIVFEGATAITDEEYEDYLNNMTEEERKMFDEKIAAASNNSTSYSPYAATKISIPGSFMIYQQPNYYYCVPACVKSMLQYINGSSDSQNKIAETLGTSMMTGTPFSTNITKYLNEKQKFLYVLSSEVTKLQLQDFTYNTVAYSGKPCMVRIANPTGRNWHYATNGHALVVNAVYSDKSKIQFADPMGGTQAGYEYYYEKTVTVSHNVTTHVIW